MRVLDLGPVQVEVDGVRSACAGTKQAAILAALAMRAGRRVPLADLVVAGWGYDATVSSSTVENHIWRLRRLLEPDRPAAASRLTNDTGGYRLNLDVDELDSTRFADRAERSRAAEDPAETIRLCDEALGLWRDAPYGAIGHATATAAAVARLEELREQLVERRLDALLATGAVDRVLVDVEALLVEHPFRERLWAVKMAALARAGRADDALGTYQRVRVLLRDELGLEPGPELQQLRQQVVAGTSTPEPPDRAPARPVRLPARLGSLIGRERELREIDALLQTRPVVTIVGPGGGGKTRLAIQVARDRAHHHPDGVSFVDLTEAADSRAVPDVVVSRLGLRVESGGARGTLRTSLADRRGLLVLDNCEHVLDGVATLVDDLAGSATTVLATSREPIDVESETVSTLAALPVAPGAADGGLSPAAELFLARADGLTGLDDDATRLVERICAAVDGLPLAVELAAARTRSFTLAELLAQVEDDPSGLGRVGRGPADHRRTLRSAIDWSHRLLDPVEQRVYRRLAVLPGPFTLPVAAAVVGPDVDVAEVPTVLAGLVHRSLLVASPPARPGGPSAFHQLETIRAHARHLLTDAGELDDALERRAGWVSGLLRRRPRIGRPEEPGWNDVVDDCASTVRATLDHLLEGPADAVRVREYAGFVWFWYYRGRAHEGADWLERALDRLGEHPGTVIPRLASASLTLSLGRVEEGRARLRAALDVLDSGSFPESHRVQLAETLVSAATGAWGCDAVDLADAVHARLAPVVAPLRDPDLDVLTDATGCLGLPADRAGPGGAVARAEAVYDRAVTLGNYCAAWMSGAVLNSVAMTTGDAAAGVRWTARLLEVVRGNGRSVATYAEVLGFFLIMRDAPGDLEDAVRLLAAGQAQATRSGAVWPALAPTRQRIEQARSGLGPELFVRAWAEGSRTHLDDATLDRAAALVAARTDESRTGAA